MMNQICEWNDFVIFHENITFGASWHMNGCPFRFAFKSAFYSPKRLNKMKLEDVVAILSLSLCF